MIRHLARLGAICVATSFCAAHAATTINVTTTAMVRAADGECSLVEAFQAVDVESTIEECVVGPGGTPFTIVLGANRVYTATSTDPIYRDASFGDNLFSPVADRTWEIIGNGSVIERPSGAPKFRFFFIENGTLTLRNVTLRGGDVLGGPPTPYGGAIAVIRGTVSLDRVTFDGNSANTGGAVFVALPPGVVNAVSSTFIAGVSGGTLAGAMGGILNVANSTFKSVTNGITDVFLAESSSAYLSHNTFDGSIYSHISHRGNLVAYGNVSAPAPRTCRRSQTGATTPALRSALAGS